jgi:hypothetical protein
VAVEKLGFPKISANSGDRKCLGDPRKSFVGHPDALRFWQISRKRVFQQPQAITLTTPVNECNGDISPITLFRRATDPTGFLLPLQFSQTEIWRANDRQTISHHRAVEKVCRVG